MLGSSQCAACLGNEVGVIFVCISGAANAWRFSLSFWGICCEVCRMIQYDFYRCRNTSVVMIGTCRGMVSWEAAWVASRG